MHKNILHSIHLISLCTFISIVIYSSLRALFDGWAKEQSKEHRQIFDPSHINLRNDTDSNKNDQNDGKEQIFGIYSDSLYKIEYFVLEIFRALQYLTVLNLPQVLSNFFGLTLFNAFKDKIKVKCDEESPLETLKLPHLCFRIVTRGLYPELVQHNVNINYATCIESGLHNFSIEVVTDKKVNLINSDGRIRQIVVPTSYTTSSGALFKARALQYALEPDISVLSEGDYIVHLDEETLLTRNSVNGIINFTLDGSHAFGQGLITYLNQGVVNWLTTLADSLRVSDDLGKLRFQFYAFHRPIFGMKGSYVVSKYEAEKDVSFDHGPDGSIAEDCFFAMVAHSKGYTFNFIDGEMLEKSPFTLMDFIRQRRRWIQGIWLVVHSRKIPFLYKLPLTMTFYGWVTLPISVLSVILSFFYVVSPNSLILSSIGPFCFAVTYYMYFFGLIKSLDLREGTKLRMVPIYLLFQFFSIFLSVVLESISVIWGVFSPKHNFYIIKKDAGQKLVTGV